MGCERNGMSMVCKNKPMTECGTKERKRVQRLGTKWLHSKGLTPIRFDGNVQPGGSEETWERSDALYRSWKLDTTKLRLVEIVEEYYQTLKELVERDYPNRGVKVVCENILEQKIVLNMGFQELDTPNSFQDNQTPGYPNKHKKIVECLHMNVGLIVACGAQRWSGRDETAKYRLLAHQYGYWSKRFHFKGTNDAPMTMLILVRKDLCKK